jgi:hypothetical protein
VFALGSYACISLQQEIDFSSMKDRCLKDRSFMTFYIKRRNDSDDDDDDVQHQTTTRPAVGVGPG